MSLNAAAWRLFDAWRDDQFALQPIWATACGHHQYDDQLADNVSDEAIADFDRQVALRQRELAALDTAGLDADDQLSCRVLAHSLQAARDQNAMPWHRMPLDPTGGGVAATLAMLGSGSGLQPFGDAGDYQRWLRRAAGFAGWADAAILSMQRGIAAGQTTPLPAMMRVPAQLRALLVDDVRDSVFFRPALQFPPTIAADEQERLTRALSACIEQHILPTYARLLDYVERKYLPHCRTSVGLCDFPDGAALYQGMIVEHTTTRLTPAEIYALGEAEVARIAALMAAVTADIERRGITEVQYGDADSLLAANRELEQSIRAALPQYFGHLPQAGFEIRAIEAFRAASAPSHYIPASPDGRRAGVFYLNTAELPQPLSVALFLHETIPGHHLQVSLQRENPRLPDFRRFGWYTAYGEGWALYAEQLGEVLGLYRDPYLLLDRLNSEMFRAARLVVDVGLHHYGWSREQCVDYLQRQSPRPRDDAEREIDRYMVWPGQALAYKIGEITLQRLLQQARQRDGAAFDLRRWHDRILAPGCLPLDLLEQVLAA